MRDMKLLKCVLLKNIDNARKKYPDKFKKNYSNHCMRHSKAMHLLESGVNLIYIRDFLGHASVTTTEIYAKANPLVKAKQILENASNVNIENGYNDTEKKDLLDFLKTL